MQPFSGIFARTLLILKFLKCVLTFKGRKNIVLVPQVSHSPSSQSQPFRITILYASHNSFQITIFILSFSIFKPKSKSQSPVPQAPGPDPKSSPSVKNQNTIPWTGTHKIATWATNHQHIGACSFPPITFNHEGVLQQGSSISKMT